MLIDGDILRFNLKKKRGGQGEEGKQKREEKKKQKSTHFKSLFFIKDGKVRENPESVTQSSKYSSFPVVERESNFHVPLSILLFCEFKYFLKPIFIT